MASANQYPPPPAPIPPPYRYRRSLAGPIILILIGGIFLAKNFGFRFPIWHWFGHWWPLLLILWGVVILIENAASNRMGYRTRRLGAGGIVLIVLLICLGASAHYSSDIDWNGVRDQLQMDDDLGGFFGTAYTFEDSLEQAFPANATLRIVCDRGALNITPSEDGIIRVAVHKKLYAQNQNDANKYNAGSKPQIESTGSTVVLNANTDGAGDHGVQTDMDIQVPAGTTLDIASKRGDVTISHRKADVKISLQHGDVSLTEVAGPVKISLEKGSIRALQIGGDVDVTGHVDNVTIDEVAGAVHLDGDFYEDIQLSKIARTVIFKTSRSDMEIASVPGDIEIASDQVRGNDLMGPSRVVTGSKDIHLEDVSGDLQVQSTNGDVEVTTGGKQAGKLSLTTQHGAIALTLAAKASPDKVNVSTQYGDVTLTLSPNAGFQINAGTRKGGITSDFGAIKVDASEGASQATGTVGNGLSKLQVNTESGDIKIGKS
ncbi:MAG: DUF4097 family beta strand repeat-containing protein [Candidatus Korobacteraceae bacterium]|jgi:DUF4097 and DUF4098 domain-containing protein YvlB